MTFKSAKLSLQLQQTRGLCLASQRNHRVQCFSLHFLAMVYCFVRPKDDMSTGQGQPAVTF